MQPAPAHQSISPRVIPDRSLLSSTAFIEVQFSPLACALSSNREGGEGRIDRVRPRRSWHDRGPVTALLDFIIRIIIILVIVKPSSKSAIKESGEQALTRQRRVVIDV